MKIVADINIPYIESVFEPYAEVVYMRGAAIAAADVADADAIVVRTRTRCDASLLAGSRVRMIATATIGTDHIDTEWCRTHGIEVASAAGCNAGGVLQWMGAALALLSEEGGWLPQEKTLGVIGVGNVGSPIARYGSMWGFRVLCSDPPREKAEGLDRRDDFVPLDELAAESDIVTFHTPLTTGGAWPTSGLGGRRFFDRLRPGATVINTSRGGVVDESLLLESVAVNNTSCCIDTWEGEPHINRLLLHAARVSTPHTAGYSAQGKANGSAAAVRALSRKFGLPLSEWSPAGVAPVYRRPITWDEMRGTVAGYCDLKAESRALKEHPDLFEQLREGYNYRQEYF